MARQQLGAPPVASQDALTKDYADRTILRVNPANYDFQTTDFQLPIQGGLVDSQFYGLDATNNNVTVTIPHVTSGGEVGSVLRFCRIDNNPAHTVTVAFITDTVRLDRGATTYTSFNLGIGEYIELTYQGTDFYWQATGGRVANANGNGGTGAFDSAATPGAAMVRDSAGRASVVDPSTPANIATKNYIDATAGTSALTVNTLVRRDLNGRASVVDPTTSAHIATKNYVDATAGTSAATASALVRRDVNGRASVADPSVPTDIATKNYTDTQDTATLTSAKSYTDTGNTSTLASAKSYADTGDTSTLASAQSYADTRGGVLVPVGTAVAPSSFNGNTTTGSPVSGTQTFVPFDVLGGGTYSSFRSNVTTASSGGTITHQYGIYYDNGDRTAPDLTRGPIASASGTLTVGIKTPAFGGGVKTLSAGRYWLSFFYYESVVATTHPVFTAPSNPAYLGFLDVTSATTFPTIPRALRITGLTAVATVAPATWSYSTAADFPLVGVFRSA